MADKFKAPRGTFDVLPEQSAQRRRLMRAAREIFGRAGYRNIVTPSFEDTALFERGVGKSTDIVRKEMFTFEDKVPSFVTSVRRRAATASSTRSAPRRSVRLRRLPMSK